VVLGKFFEHPRRKRPEMVKREWFFHKDKSSVRFAAILKSRLSAKAFKVLEHPHFLPELALAGFFMLRKVKEELSCLTLDHGSLKKVLVGVMRTITEDEFTIPFQGWYDRCQKCICINNGYVKKSLKINVFLTTMVLFL
jgi:hypothetical protein